MDAVDYELVLWLHTSQECDAKTCPMCAKAKALGTFKVPYKQAKMQGGWVDPNGSNLLGKGCK